MWRGYGLLRVSREGNFDEIRWYVVVVSLMN